MDKASVTAELTRIFRDVFDNDDIVLRDDMTARDVDGWDSITHIRLLLSVEEAFDFNFDAGEAPELQNVGHLIAAVLRHLG